ncbi:MAG TPA: anthranilate phosphoribosyltransferase [Candidatus Nitrosotalea sp.]|nr:anthranilate phosphoribosyltransferase [Candidatus Nitrosotalea sp.]
MIPETMAKLSAGEHLTYDEMRGAVSEILDGRSSVLQTTEFLRRLTAKGETDGELVAMLDSMQEHAIHIEPRCSGKVIDVCGTGGDRMRTFNVSTTAAFVVAAAGVNVAKHGNRSSSGISGSADIFEHFGYDLGMEPQRVREIIERFRIGFMFAQKFHPAMKNVAEARKAVGGRTAFNLLGPLSNPARVTSQLVGVFSPEYLKRVVGILQSRGAEDVITAISEDGLDELSVTSKNRLCHLRGGEVHEFVLDPTEIGLSRASLDDIQVSTREEAILAFVHALDGTGKKATIEITALNAAAALVVGGKASNIKEGLETSIQTMKSGKAFDLLKNFIKHCGDIGKIEELEKN